MADDLVPGRVEDRRLALEDRDEGVGLVADLEQLLADRGGPLLAVLGQHCQLGAGENATHRTGHASRLPVRGRLLLTSASERTPMRNPFTHKKLDEVKDSATDFGHGDTMEARFAKGDLETEETGFSFHRLKPNKRQPFGHNHEDAEEVYVVVRGDGPVQTRRRDHRGRDPRRDPRLAGGDPRVRGRRRWPRGPRLRPPPRRRRLARPRLLDRLTAETAKSLLKMGFSRSRG